MSAAADKIAEARKVRRYKLVSEDGWHGMSVRPDGGYVSHKDHYALADLADALAQENAKLRADRIDWEWLDAEITAIPTRYHGDPSHDHDAYWFKTEVLDLIRKAAGWDAAALTPETEATP